MSCNVNISIECGSSSRSRHIHAVQGFDYATMAETFVGICMIFVMLTGPYDEYIDDGDGRFTILKLLLIGS